MVLVFPFYFCWISSFKCPPRIKQNSLQNRPHSFCCPGLASTPMLPLPLPVVLYFMWNCWNSRGSSLLIPFPLSLLTCFPYLIFKSQSLLRGLRVFLLKRENLLQVTICSGTWWRGNMLSVGNSGRLPTICGKGFSKPAQCRNIAGAQSAAFFNGTICKSI